MPAGKQAVIWQDGGGELLATIVNSDDSVTGQRRETDAAPGFRFLGVATVLNVADSRARRARGASDGR
jgi:hypothetical protein